MQLPPIRKTQPFKQSVGLQPATDLWRLFTLVELQQNMKQQQDNTFKDILNALLVGVFDKDHLLELNKKVSDANIQANLLYIRRCESIRLS
ncbi:hypothetical protein NPIL_205961 [Nephila pilipes]|uniref:Uncharacterized protein n=1 Tax=Nephila pilipes TaxID=299642 RepID=A0A8X6PEL0_NEPPI|nr:hypothetical protein NPIL_205961 [Nephila pilipes]